MSSVVRLDAGYNIPVAAFAHLRKLHLKHSDYIIEPQETLQWFLFSGTKYSLFFSSESFSSLATLNRQCRSSHRNVFAVHTPAHTPPPPHTHNFTNLCTSLCVSHPSTRICALIWILIYLIDKMPFSYSLCVCVQDFIFNLIWNRMIGYVKLRSRYQWSFYDAEWNRLWPDKKSICGN